MVATKTKTTKTTTKNATVKPVTKEKIVIPAELTQKALCSVLSGVMGVVIPEVSVFKMLGQAGEKYKLEPYELGQGAAYTRDYLTRVVEKYNGQDA